MTYYVSSSIYLPTCVSGAQTRVRARARVAEGNNLQKKGVEKPIFLIEALDWLLAGQLSAKIVKRPYKKPKLEVILTICLNTKRWLKFF